ncbi:MAG: calcium/sodium antiporter [Thermotogae bacterium]|nr:calcium/sodium antiporter [Thermotogota bacterium]
MNWFFLVVGLALLIKGADWTVEGGSGLARKLGVSELFIGLSIVSIGTSLPELAVSLGASIKGSGAISVSNVIGSNIANIGLGLSVAALVHPIFIERSTLRKELPFNLLVGIAFSAMLLRCLPPSLDRVDGIILLAFALIFFDYLTGMMKGKKVEHSDNTSTRSGRNESLLKLLSLTAIGIAGVTVGGDLTVDAAVKIAREFGVSETLIGLTLVAVGTSIPEVMTTTVAMAKRRHGIAAGNIVGSNIFNIVMIIGIASTIREIKMDVTNILPDLIYMNALPVLLLLLSGKRSTLSRFGGAILLSLYVIYIVYVVFRG